MIDPSYWKNRRVLITGNTGLKGAWLAVWLQHMGASVCGYSLAAPSTPSLHDLIQDPSNACFHVGDVRDLGYLENRLNQFQPELVVHMAAQSLVRESYDDPVNTFSTNVMGTVNTLQAVRNCQSVRAVICVTSDKCYENNGQKNHFIEADPLGGHDPYSASKGCAEIAINAYRDSYFAPPDKPRIASVRAGNVIGGGDWADDRLIPDLIRAIQADTPGIVRNPKAVRPWQHVLDCLSGYLVLAHQLLESDSDFSGAWNFGPSTLDAKPASNIADRIISLWGGKARWQTSTQTGPHEAGFLALDSTKATTQLQWQPKLSLEDALDLTVQWYRAYDNGDDVRAMTLAQISDYLTL